MEKDRQNKSSRIAKRKLKMKNQHVHRYHSYVPPMCFTRSLLVEGIPETSSGLNLFFFLTCFPVFHFAQARGDGKIKDLVKLCERIKRGGHKYC